MSRRKGKAGAVAELDPRTPVLVGVGQFAERIDEPGYAALSAVDLAARAASAALSDTGADPAALAAAVDTVAGIRQFEMSLPGARSPLGRSNNYPRSVAGRIGADPGRAILEISGGQSPQHLITELCGAIADGRGEVVLAFGSEAISTARHLAASEDAPDFTEHVEGDLEDRGPQLHGVLTTNLTSHGLAEASALYAIIENARRARLGLSREDYALEMGRLLAPFSEVAARNPYSVAPKALSAKKLARPSERNRPVADPYTRYLVSREIVNQSAAVLLMSVGAAKRLGVPRKKWVFLAGHADLREQGLLDREDLSRAPATVQAVEDALDLAGITADQLSTIDLYSCFPIAVFTVIDGLGIAPDDPRGLTVTGGMPFFGGAGNNYSMHAVAETVARCRQDRGTFGLVAANGGVISKYSVGVYTTEPAPWRPSQDDRRQAELDARPRVPTTERADGWARIESFTVTHSRDGERTGSVVGRLDHSGERFVAQGLEDDDQILDLLATDQPIGRTVYVRSFGIGNRVTVSEERMDQLRPITPPRIRDRYEHLMVERDGHLLEITINRAESRNSLHPPANEELEEVFDAFFADPDLWVAILTGAGEQSFCSGNDLAYTRSGNPLYTPKSGFGGLTSRRDLPKPVIAAVNGYAMGGGLETALACHLIVVDEAAQLALSEVKVGMMAGAGGAVRLPRQLPPRIAYELILTGRRMGADEALARGLVNRVTPPGEALKGARELAADILQGSPTSIRISLDVMRQTRGIPDDVDAVTHRSASEAVDQLVLSEDMREGLAAFAEKRAPVWRNR